MPDGINPIVRRFIQDAGHVTQSIGLGRILGQLYSYLYFSPEPRNLADMQRALGISKGSASTTVRQLEQWGAVQKVWVKGDRKDFYQAEDWFGKIVRNAVFDTVGKKLQTYTALIAEAEAYVADMKGGGSDADRKFLEKRVRQLRAFRDKTQRIWNSPVVRMMLR